MKESVRGGLAAKCRNSHSRNECYSAACGVYGLLGVPAKEFPASHANKVAGKAQTSLDDATKTQQARPRWEGRSCRSSPSRRLIFCQSGLILDVGRNNEAKSR